MGGLYGSVHALMCAGLGTQAVCLCMHLSTGPKGARVQRSEICSVGRLNVTNTPYLDTCTVSVSPLAQSWTVITGKDRRGSTAAEKEDSAIWR